MRLVNMRMQQDRKQISQKSWSAIGICTELNLSAELESIFVEADKEDDSQIE